MYLDPLDEQDMITFRTYCKIISLPNNLSLFSPDKKLQRTESFKIIKEFNISPSCKFQIILINGKTIFANFVEQNNNKLNLFITSENSILVPLNKVAGIIIIDYVEDKILIDSKELSFCPAINKSAYDYMKNNSLSYAKDNNFNIKHSLCEYQLYKTQPFKWGDLSYKIDTALYADWNYLQNISGGINALGIGIGIFSLSSGWSKSLWSQFKNKVQQKSIDIDKINLENEVVVQGYISFIKSYDNLPNFENSIETIKMEGSSWIPAIISNKKIINALDIKTTAWTLVYLKEDGLMFPLNVWDRLTKPINIYCEVIHITISTEFGTIPFYLKARCAAYIKD